MCNRCKELENQLKSTLRVLELARRDSEDLTFRLVQCGKQVYNRGQFNNLVDGIINEGLELLGMTKDDLKSIL